MAEAGETLAALLASARRAMTESGIENAALDARVIVEHFSGTTRADAIARSDMTVDAGAVRSIHEAVARRIAGEPVYRILGFRDFYGMRLLLSTETLEPRPDTEALVDVILPYLRQLAASGQECRILDLGTGSGAIALALLAAIPAARAIGVDVSADALATAARNALENGLSDRFEAVRSDWFEKISGEFQAIVSNPPYISSKELETLQREVLGHDPLKALHGGEDGLDAYRAIAAKAGKHIAPGGVVAVEIGHTQKADVVALFETAGFTLVEARKDLAGRDRALVFSRG